MRCKHAALALAHLLTDFAVIQPREDFLRQGFQFGYEAVIRVKFAERSVVMRFIDDLAVGCAVGHVDEAFDRYHRIFGLDCVHHDQPLEAIQLPFTQGRQPLGEVIHFVEIGAGKNKLR
ncbi:hypothetical protein SDC9_158393 [bioreactor metagenome]|uniref:Uncharacterized protein n=1 Tax=bioreactor metagenome TaxID=1076179 RepID=A0A645FBZ6_9ZZZZ